MKNKLRFTFAVVLLVFTACFVIMAYNRWLNWQAEQQAAEFEHTVQVRVNALLKQHYTEGLWLLEQIKNLPEEVKVNANHTLSWKKTDPITLYVHKPDLESILFDIDTLIHESSHMYHSHSGVAKAAAQQLLTPGDQTFFNYWLNSKTEFLVRADSVFPAREIATLLPEATHTERLREYITESDSDMATQSNGLFGLIDEWVAYYQGLRIETALLQVVSTQLDKQPESERQAWRAFASRMSSSYLAYFEFKLYILAYLHHAKNQHPQMYRALLANPMLQQVLTEVNQAYQTILPEYLQLRKRYLDVNSAESQAFISKLQTKQQQLVAEINKPNYMNLREQFMRDKVKP